MKKTEAISILATSVRPREPKDRARYDEAVKMAIEALKCSETPKSSERTAETAQNAQDKDLGWTILSKSIIPTLVPAGVVADIVQNQLHLEESIHRIKQLTGIGIDDLIDLFAQGYELKAPSAQPEIIRCKECRYKELKGVDYYCDHITGEEIMVSPNDFCSWAERGTDEQTKKGCHYRNIQRIGSDC